MPLVDVRAFAYPNTAPQEIVVHELLEGLHAPNSKMIQYGLCPKSLSTLTQQVNTSVHQSFTVWTSPSPQ